MSGEGGSHTGPVSTCHPSPRRALPRGRRNEPCVCMCLEGPSTGRCASHPRLFQHTAAGMRSTPPKTTSTLPGLLPRPTLPADIETSVL